MPKISALMPVYNTNPQHLREAIESVLSQTFKDFELLIINNSPEKKELKKIVLGYKDSRIIYKESKENLGIAGSYNKFIEMSRGEYLAICEHDDTWPSYRFDKQVDFLDKNSNIGVVGGAVKWMTEKPYIAKYAGNNRLIKLRLMSNCHFSHPCSMIRKSILIKNNVRYEEQYSPSCDYMLWCRLMEFTQFHSLSDVMIYYRVHDTRTSVLQAKRMEDVADEIRLFVRNKYPVLYYEYLHEMKTIVRLFWVIPFFIIKPIKDKSIVYLFGFIPVIKIKKRWL